MAPWQMELQIRSRMRIAEDWHSRLGVCRMGLEEGSVLCMFSLGLYWDRGKEKGNCYNVNFSWRELLRALAAASLPYIVLLDMGATPGQRWAHGMVDVVGGLSLFRAGMYISSYPPSNHLMQNVEVLEHSEDSALEEHTATPYSACLRLSPKQ